jgi:hypothetical protein
VVEETMKFKRIEPEEGYGNIARWRSEGGNWDIRLDPVIFGCRVHVQYKGSMVYLTDYCAGDKSLWHNAIVLVVMNIMEKYPEDVEVGVITNIWPKFDIRPMWNDKKCWHSLCEMADMSEEFEGSMLMIK